MIVMSSLVPFALFVLFALLESSHMISLSRATTTVNLAWSANVSTLYPPSTPLRVYLGDMLNITCPANGTSNIWIQEYLQQYEQCNCNATGIANSSKCTPGITTRQICQDEVLIAITSDSNNLKSALSFNSGTTYYLLSYSPGDRPLAGYLDNISGGECLRGFKMVMQVVSTATTEEVRTTTAAATTEATTTSIFDGFLPPATGDTPPPGIVNDPAIGSLVNGAVATISRVSITLLVISIIFGLFCVCEL